MAFKTIWFDLIQFRELKHYYVSAFQTENTINILIRGILLSDKRTINIKIANFNPKLRQVWFTTTLILKLI